MMANSLMATCLGTNAVVVTRVHCSLFTLGINGRLCGVIVALTGYLICLQ